MGVDRNDQEVLDVLTQNDIAGLGQITHTFQIRRPRTDRTCVRCLWAQNLSVSNSGDLGFQKFPLGPWPKKKNEKYISWVTGAVLDSFPVADLKIRGGGK